MNVLVNVNKTLKWRGIDCSFLVVSMNHLFRCSFVLSDKCFKPLSFQYSTSIEFLVPLHTPEVRIISGSCFSFAFETSHGVEWFPNSSNTGAANIVKSRTLRCLRYAQHKIKKNTKITATQNTTDTAAQTSCPTIDETLASDIFTQPAQLVA